MIILCRPVPLTLSPPLVAPRAFSATALLRLAMPYGIRGSIVVHLPAGVSLATLVSPPACDVSALRAYICK